MLNANSLSEFESALQQAEDTLRRGEFASALSLVRPAGRIHLWVKVPHEPGRGNR